MGETKLKIDTEKIYKKHNENCAPVKARPHTVSYLLNYSNSRNISEIRA